MADTIAVMNDGQDRAGRLGRRPLRAPAHRVRGELPRRLQPRSTASSARATAASRASRPTTAPRCTCPPTASARTATDASASACGPRRSRCVPAGDGTRPTARNVLRGTVVVAAFLGVSIQYVITGAGRRGAHRVRPEPRRRRAGVARRRPRGPADLEPAAHVRRRQGASRELTDIERALERVLRGERLSRRASSAAPALARARPAALLAACGGVEGDGREGRQGQAGRRASTTRRSPIGDWTFSNWPLYIDKKVLKTFDKRTAATSSTSRRSTTTSSSSGRSASSCRPSQPIGRDIVTLTDYMAAKLGPRRLRRADRQEERPEHRRTSSTTCKSINYDPKREYTLPWQSGAIGHRLQHQEDRPRAQERQRPLRPGVQGQGDDALRALRLGRLRCCWQGIDPSTAKIDQILGAIEKIEKANDAGQFRRFTGNDYTTDLAKGNVWVALAYSGDLVQLQSDNPDLRFAYPEEGAMLFTDNMMMPGARPSTRTRPRR